MYFLQAGNGANRKTGMGGTVCMVREVKVVAADNQGLLLLTSTQIKGY